MKMTFSGLTLHYSITDLNAYLPARIQKIQVLSYDQIVLDLYHKETIKLYLNLSPQNAKMHRTKSSFSVKTEPTVFINRLKKWLLNATLMPFTQFSKDRIIKAVIQTKNELYDEVQLELILEFFGKDANLILIDANQKIIDCLKTSGALFSQPRLIQIGATYSAPVSTKKDPLNPVDVEAYFQSDSRNLIGYFDGLSSTLADQLEPFKTPHEFLHALSHPQFILGETIPHFGHADEAVTFVEWADDHLLKDKEERPYDQRRLQILKVLKKRLERAQKKESVLTLQLNEIPRADALTAEGQALMAAPEKHEKKSHIDVFDYTEGQPITLMLDQTKTVLENAQLRFKKAKKIKASIPHLKKQLKINQTDMDYYRLIMYQLEEATQESLEGIYKELALKRLIKLKATPKKVKKTPGKIYQTMMNNAIYVGLNNEQNAFLTHEKAKPNEYWAHVRGYPGSHVILATSTPTEAEMIQACELAAYYSKAKNLIEVDVDITPVKHVKKIPGHHGCFVRYDQAKTYSVKPKLS
jgi:predicted ribosome quality control (RQC) complex YloA/Tae2 family protein